MIEKELERIDYVCKMKNVNTKKMDLIKRDLEEQKKFCT